jgi:hypothetical protein
MEYTLTIGLGLLLHVEIGGPAASGTMTADEASKDKSNDMHFLKTVTMYLSIEEDHVRDHQKSGFVSQQCQPPTQHKCWLLCRIPTNLRTRLGIGFT